MQNCKDKFSRYWVLDPISNTMNSTSYFIGYLDEWMMYDGKDFFNDDDDVLVSWCKIELNLKDNRPSLSFTYPTKEKYRTDRNIKLKKGDKLFFSNAINTYLELEVIQPPHIGNGEGKKTVDFFLLEKDIDTLIKNNFKKIIIVYKDGSPRTWIDNIWYGYSDCSFWNKGVKRPQKTGEAIFRVYVTEYKKTLSESKLFFCSKKKKNTKIKLDPCYVYLMHDEKNGYYKIGISKTPKYREKTLQSEKPTIELICSKQYPSRKIAEAIESALHKVYEESRIRGEWFDLSDSDVILLKKTLI